MSSTSHPKLPDPASVSKNPSEKPTITRIDQATKKSTPPPAPAGARNEAIFTLGQALAGTKFGDIEPAIAAIPHLLEVPAGITVADLRLNPLWDPPRKDPRFQKLCQEPNK